jgi:aspartyl/asparaginyl-tRNA synthetase
LSELKDKLVGIDGNIKSIKNEANAIAIELGDTNTMSSIICQIDTRYTKEFNQLKTGEHIALKGIITGYTIDTDLGFGNTVEMNYCTKNTK